MWFEMVAVWVLKIGHGDGGDAVKASRWGSEHSGFELNGFMAECVVKLLVRKRACLIARVG